MSVGLFATPGIEALHETFENEVCWGPSSKRLLMSAFIDGATRDAGNTPTTVLRPGLVLAQQSNGKFIDYSPTANDGYRNVALAVLGYELRAQDFNATNRDRFFQVLVGGPVKASQLYGLDAQAKQQMANRFVFDTDLAVGPFLGWRQILTKTADYPVVAADNNTLFRANKAGAFTFTLPALAAATAAMRFGFTQLQDQNMIVQRAGADTMVALGNAAAVSVTFSTASQKIGATLEVVSAPDFSKWNVIRAVGTQTVA